eukprot:259319-Alexandrium_andersonii.AAC.1
MCFFVGRSCVWAHILRVCVRASACWCFCVCADLPTPRGHLRDRRARQSPPTACTSTPTFLVVLMASCVLRKRLPEEG